MTERPTIFISAVSSELRIFRQGVRDVLLAKDVFPIVQDNFPTDYRKVREVLTENITKSDAVICLVGFAYGVEPRKRPDSEPRRSYTQLEYHLACELQKPVYVFLTDDRARPCDTVPNEDDERRQLQLAHRENIRNHDELWHQFATLEELKTKVAEVPIVNQAGFKISSGRLRHGADRLFGREQELAALDRTWNDPAKHVLTIVAFGGVGKTSLVVEWMARKAAANWPSFDCVFDWSFYSQGTREQSAASSDIFIAKALKFFGDEKMAASAASPWDKGERLAQLVAKRRSLLVLDGLEPLQHPPGPLAGQLKDPALAALLRGLAHHNPGLCLVTTRERVADLSPFCETTSPEWELQHLSTPAGVELLKDLRVRGTETDLQRLVEDVAGHALTINLLGRYLAKAHRGDIHKRDVVKFEKAECEFKTNPADADKPYGHAFKVMAAYEHWLAASGDKGRRQLAVLRLLGLFDRPADAGCLAALRHEPAIPGLTEPLVGLDEDDWNLTLSSLADCGLVSVWEDRSSPYTGPSSLDAHPLVREYFAKQLRENNPEAWRSAHRRIYEHLKEVAPHQPDTLEEMIPLLAAVVHGCKAGRHVETYRDVYVPRLQRWSEEYIVSRLGAFGADLAAVSCFFENLWDNPLRCLGTRDRDNLLNIAGFDLHGLGRLGEAIHPMHAAFCGSELKQDWGNAAISANNLSELCLATGDISQAIQYAQQGVDLADMELGFPSLKREGLSGFLRRVLLMILGTAVGRLYRRPKQGSFAYLIQWRRDIFRLYQLGNRESLAHALRQAGRLCEAQIAFCEAEKMQKSDRSGQQSLHPQATYRYCDFLVGEAEILVSESKENQAVERLREAEQRLQKTFIGKGSRLLDIALCQLMAGRVHMLLALYSGSSDFTDPKLELDRAVEELRHAGACHFMPCGLLARAMLNRVRGELELAEVDLAEALEIAAGTMKLHETDCHLEYARLYLSIARKDQARVHCEKAKSLITQTGYHRRDAEVRHLEQSLVDQNHTRT